MGRPLKFKTVKDLEDKIQAYFESCFDDRWEDEIVRDPISGKVSFDKKGKPIKQPVKKTIQTKPITITGLAVALDTSRETLCNYEDKEDYFDTIKKAKSYIENILEEGMLNGKINPAAGIFNAKNNFGWKDKTELDHKGTLGISLTTLLDAANSE